MAVASQNVITSADTINYFNNQANTVLNTATYHSGSYPYFSGTAGSTTNPIAIPSGQLAAKSITYLNAQSGTMTASSLWSAINSIARTFNKVRKWSSTWQFNNNGAYGTVQTISGTAVFNTSFPGVPDGWGRSGGNVDLWPSADGTLAAQHVITPASLTNTVANCYNTWYANCINANTISYTLYTCHSSCHSSCYTERNRR